MTRHARDAARWFWSPIDHFALIAAVWPRGRGQLGVSVGLCGGYVGLVSFAFPGTWAGVSEAMPFSNSMSQAKVRLANR